VARFEPLTAGESRFSDCCTVAPAATAWRWRLSASLSTDTVAGEGDGRLFDKFKVTLGFGPPILIFGGAGPLILDFATSNSDLKCSYAGYISM
jgi:hypothetical protein